MSLPRCSGRALKWKKCGCSSSSSPSSSWWRHQAHHGNRSSVDGLSTFQEEQTVFKSGKRSPIHNSSYLSQILHPTSYLSQISHVICGEKPVICQNCRFQYMKEKFQISIHYREIWNLSTNRRISNFVAISVLSQLHIFAWGKLSQKLCMWRKKTNQRYGHNHHHHQPYHDHHKVPADTDVLITHTPPVGFGDLCSTGV